MKDICQLNYHIALIQTDPVKCAIILQLTSKEGTDVYAKERAVLEENENERATLSLRQSLKKNTVTELEGMVDECSLDEGQFPFALDDKRRGLVNKSGFYIQGNILVIDDARMRQHSKIIIKNVIN